MRDLTQSSWHLGIVRVSAKFFVPSSQTLIVPFRPAKWRVSGRQCNKTNALTRYNSYVGITRRRAEGKHGWDIGMAYQRLVNKRACLNIKNTNCIVFCPGYDPFRIWGPVDDPHPFIIMVRQDMKLARSGCDIPYGNSGIVTCGREAVSIRRICKPTYLDGYSIAEAGHYTP